MAIHTSFVRPPAHHAGGRFLTMPHGTGLIAPAEDAAAACLPLLRAWSVPFVSLVWDRKTPRLKVRVYPWLPGPALCEHVSANGVSRETARAVNRSAAALCRLIARCWPSDAVPDVIGVVTDGKGLAFSEDHPSALSIDWLVDHLRGEAPATAILPFNPHAFETLLSAQWVRLNS